MEIRFSGTYTKDDLLLFDRAVRKAFGLPSLYANVGCFGVAALVGVPLAVAAIMRGDESASVQWFILGGAAAVIAAWYGWLLRRAVSKNPLFGQPISGVFRDDGFEIVLPATKTQSTWTALASALRSAEFLLLIGTTGTNFGLSAAFFATTSDFLNACTLVQSHVTGKLPSRPGAKRVWSIAIWVVVIVFIILLWNLFTATEHAPR